MRWYAAIMQDTASAQSLDVHCRQPFGIGSTPTMQYVQGAYFYHAGPVRFTSNPVPGTPRDNTIRHPGQSEFEVGSCSA